MDEGDIKIEEAPTDEKIPEEQVYMEHSNKHFQSFPTLTLTLIHQPNPILFTPLPHVKS